MSISYIKIFNQIVNELFTELIDIFPEETKLKVQYTLFQTLIKANAKQPCIKFMTNSIKYLEKIAARDEEFFKSADKPDILQSNDTARLSLSIRLLDTMKQYTYAGVLAERLGNIQNTSERYHSAARYYLLATEEHKNELMLFKKARKNLETAIALTPQNLDAKVDLAVSIYNINNFQKPDDRMDLMKPAKLLLEVVRTDSTHIDAQYYLAKLAIESNQLEKAIEFGYQLRNNNKPINSGIDWVKEFNSLNKL